MIGNYLNSGQKKQSHWVFSILCTVFLCLYFVRDVFGIVFSYYIIYAVALVTVLVVSREEAVCFFMAISSFVSAGLDGVFCTLLFGCILLRFAFSIKKVKVYSLFLVMFCLLESLHYIYARKISIGVLLTYITILMSLAVIQQYPNQKLDKDLCINSFIAFSLGYIIIVITKMTVEYGSLEELMRYGLRTEEYQEAVLGYGIQPNQNYLTQLSSLNFALCALMISKKHKRLPYICTMVVFLICGLLTVSKSFVVVVAAVALYLVFLSVKRSVWKGLGMIFVIVICMAILFRLFGDTLIEIIIQRFETEDLTTGRTDINRALLDRMNANPTMYFVGTGILQVHRVTRSAIHSSVFEILGGWGVFGFVPVIGYMLLLVRDARYNNKRTENKANGYHYLPLLMLIGYTLNGMLFSSAFTVVQIMVCIYAIQVREKGTDALQHNCARV